jgi:hypothetical protein
VAIGKSILHTPIKYYHLKLFIKILFLKSISCVIYHLSFDGVAAFDDSNWYIKRLNYIEIDKNKCFILDRYVTIFLCLPCFKPLVTVLTYVFKRFLCWQNNKHYSVKYA